MKPRVCIISGRYPRSSFESNINHFLYSQFKGYYYINCNWPTEEKNRYLNKIRYLQYYIDLFDYLIWIDDDAFFVDFDMDIMQYAPQGDAFLSICSSPDYKAIKTFLSSGQFILKANDKAKLFLDRIMQTSIEDVKHWWPEEMGYYTNGDQDIIVYLLKVDKDFYNGFKLYNYKHFNSRIDCLIREQDELPLVLHFTGKVEQKKRDYEKAQALLKRNATLSPQDILAKYNYLPNRKNKGLQEKIKQTIDKYTKKIQGH